MSILSLEQYDNLDPDDAHYIFDFVLTHLFEQGERAAIGRDCMYRGHNQTACAVGCLIPNEVYHLGMENMSIWGLLNEFSTHDMTKVHLMLDYNAKLLSDLQAFHDGYFTIKTKDQQHEYLADLAKAYGLYFNYRVEDMIFFPLEDE